MAVLIILQGDLFEHKIQSLKQLHKDFGLACDACTFEVRWQISNDLLINTLLLNLKYQAA